MNRLDQLRVLELCLNNSEHFTDPFFLFIAAQNRYLVRQFDGGSLLRIEPVKGIRDNVTYECLAENKVGDAVTATATLNVHEGTVNFCNFNQNFLHRLLNS